MNKKAINYDDLLEDLLEIKRQAEIVKSRNLKPMNLTSNEKEEVLDFLLSEGDSKAKLWTIEMYLADYKKDAIEIIDIIDTIILTMKEKITAKNKRCAFLSNPKSELMFVIEAGESIQEIIKKITTDEILNLLGENFLLLLNDIKDISIHMSDIGNILLKINTFFEDKTK